ncbi:MAG TPA: glycosyltransferase [Sedimentisphaerales bacterium]|nr:glycosyltransferase [Sedimentisphaerales bacterium]
MTSHSKESSEKKLRVLQIIASPAMGGIENQLLAFLQRYDRKKYVVEVACGGGTTGSLRDAYLATTTRLIPCKWSRYVIPFVWRLFRILKRERYDVIHARLTEVSGAAMLAAKLAGVPTRIASYHHTKTRWRNPGLLTRMSVSILERMTRRWATKILSISEACLDVYHPDWRQHPEQFEICYNGVDTDRFSAPFVCDEVRSELGLPAVCSVLGHVGGFREVKNHQALVEIAQRVYRLCDNVYFLLVGDGALRQQIETEVSKRGLSGRFVFAGTRCDVPRMLAAMDVFVMPSLDEGFGTVVVEAQLGGLVVIASNIPSMREALSPGLQQFCCAPNDAAGMAEHIVMLLKNTQLRQTLGREAREYAAKRFSIEKTVRQLEAVCCSPAPCTSGQRPRR